MPSLEHVVFAGAVLLVVAVAAFLVLRSHKAAEALAPRADAGAPDAPADPPPPRPRRRSTLDGPGQAMVVSAYGMCGRRESMQDAHFAVADKKGAVAGVFDGCGGARASRACADLLGGDEDRRRALRDAGAGEAAIAAWLEACEARVLAASEAGGWIDASTALVARVNGNDVAVGWLGDSRAVLAVDDGKGGLAALDLSVDHKASNPREAKRVRAAGGFVGRTEQEARASGARALLGKMAPALAFRANKRSAFRVYPGGIALTRCIGARPLKFKNLVTATPETFARPCDGAEAFLILACDGVWDVLDGAAAVKCCAAVAPEKAAETLVYHAHNKGSTDNLTAVVLSWP